MKKSASHLFAAAAVATVAFATSSPALACGYYQPGLFEWLAGPQFVRPATCIYQGDRIAEQGPIYSGPAIVHPQPVYQPTVTYPHGLGAGMAVAPRETVVRRTTVRRAARVTTRSKGKPEIVRANAEVKIYSPERMEIRLYRR